ncbi:MAG: hemolysin family protein [Trueperaceae bacterium]|nr:hemolysin family protein [Trueperaceae bacterium]
MIAILVVLVLIVLNGVLAMSELALASSRRSILKERAEEGHAAASRALALYDDPNRFLGTIQIGISLVGVLSGAYGAQALAGPLGGRLAAWGVPETAAVPLAFALVVAVITFLALVIGEMAPKRIALAAPERVATLVAGPMGVASRLAAPLVSLLSWSTDLVLRPFGVSGRQHTGASPEEISGLLEQGRRVGRIGQAEAEMIENVFDLEDRRVRSMLTPRREVHWIDVDAPWAQQRQALLDANHSRLPVARGELDELVGVVRVHALLDQCLLGEDLALERLAEPALAVPESLSALLLLERFRERGTRFAVVLDEYGGVEGVVTAGDVLAALLGELADGTHANDPSVVRLGDDAYDLDGKLYVEELKDLLELQTLPREEERDYRTLGGLITTLMGRIPQVGDAVNVAVWRFEVTHVDGPRVDRVHVEPADTDEAGTPEAEEAPDAGVLIGRPGDDAEPEPQAGGARDGQAERDDRRENEAERDGGHRDGAGADDPRRDA